MLIVCEGKETEPNYFRALRDEPSVHKKSAITVKRGRGGSRLDIVREAVKEKEQGDGEFDETWCVLDVEHPQSIEAQDDLARAVELARRNDIDLAFSNPSFEVWLLAHFLRSSRSFPSGGAVVTELKKQWKRLGQGALYDKADEGIYSRLAGLTRQAIENARVVRENDHADESDILKCNSATDVYLLVERLLS